MTASRFSSRVKRLYRFDCLQISIDSLRICFLKVIIPLEKQKLYQTENIFKILVLACSVTALQDLSVVKLPFRMVIFLPEADTGAPAGHSAQDIKPRIRGQGIRFFVWAGLNSRKTYSVRAFGPRSYVKQTNPSDACAEKVATRACSS